MTKFMSDKVKMNFKRAKISVKAQDQDPVDEVEEKPEDIFQKQLQAQYQLGLNKGYQAATEELEKTYSDKLFNRIKDIHNITSGLEQKILEQENNFESIVTQLAMIVAEKIIRREVDLKPIAGEVMKESLRKIIGANNVKVRLNPTDFSELQSEANQVLNDSAFTKIKFEGDERIEQGGCFIESEIGNVDARLSSQLSELKKNIDTLLSPEAKE
jgi:flagellar assembly protein FliH